MPKRQTLIVNWALCNCCESSPCLWIQIGEVIVERCKNWEIVMETVDPENVMTNYQRKIWCYKMFSMTMHVTTRIDLPYAIIPSCIKEKIRKIYPNDYYRGYARFGNYSSF